MSCDTSRCRRGRTLRLRRSDCPSSGLLSMLQSWGRSTTRQDASANEGASAPLGSPRKNFHPASAASSCLGELVLAALIETGHKARQHGSENDQGAGLDFHEDLFLVADFAGFLRLSQMAARRSFRGAQSQQDYADGFAEQAIDRLAVFLLDFVSQGGEAALRSDHRVDDGVHREIRVEIASGESRRQCPRGSDR